jgi:5-methylthioribose kinase
MTATKVYEPLNLDSVKDFASARLSGTPVTAEEIGDGNLNLVFRVTADDESSVIVKQALPYLRVVGKGWPLTLDRARIEAQALRIQHHLCPGLVPKLCCYDETQAAIAMEDLRAHVLLRRAMTQGKTFPRVAVDLGRFCAQTLLGTSDLLVNPPEKKQQVSSFINAELCAITESLILNDPFADVPTNDFEPGLAQEAKAIWVDEELQTAAAQLHFEFCTRAEALVHGDLHTGSVMVTESDTKVIDPEFAFYGPIGFDLGVLFANLAMSAIAHTAQSNNRYADWVSSTAEEFWKTFCAEIFGLWPQHRPGVETFLQRWLADAARYAGAEMIRRTIGLAHVIDLDEIRRDDERLTAKCAVLAGGRSLMVQGHLASSVNDLWSTAMIGSDGGSRDQSGGTD